MKVSSGDLARIAAFLFAVLSARAKSVEAQSNTLDLTIHYEIPEFGMKLVILDDQEVDANKFQAALDIIVRQHMNDYLKKSLPSSSKGGLVNRDNFSNVALHSKVVYTTVDPDDAEGVKIKVVRAGFEGVGNFLFSPDIAEEASLRPDVVEDAIYMLHHVKEALGEDGGFWDLAALMSKDVVLSRSGKLQIAVGNLVVGEGSLIDDDVANDNLSKLGITLISVFVPIGCILIVIAFFVVRRKIKECRLEKFKRERREKARRRRIYSSSSSAGSSRSMGSANAEHRDWMDEKAEKLGSVPGRLNALPSQKQQPPRRQLRARPALQARQKSSESLLHCIVEESGHEETSRRSEGDAAKDIENIFGNSALDSSSEYDSFQGFEGFQSCDLLEYGDTVSNDGSKSSMLSGAALDFDKAQGSAQDSFFSYGSNSQSYSYSQQQGGDLNSASFLDYNQSNQENNVSKSSYRDNYFNNSSSTTSQSQQGNDANASANGSQQDVFGLMNQERFDTLNPDEFDFDLSAANLSVDVPDLNGSLSLDHQDMDLGVAMATFSGQSMDLSMEIDFGTSDNNDDDYELRIDPNLEFA